MRYTVALNPFVRASVGKSRAEKVVCPLHPGTHRERMDPLGGLLEGERTGHRREDRVEKGEGRRGGDSAKGYAASIQAEDPLLHSLWWIASSLYQPSILKLIVSIWNSILVFYSYFLHRAFSLCVVYLDVLYLPKCAVCNIMHCTDYCAPKCNANGWHFHTIMIIIILYFNIITI